MERGYVAGLACLLALALGGCGGSGSGTPSTAAPEPEPVEDGVGMSAPIRTYIVARRHGPAQIQPGPHTIAASPCYGGGSGGLAVIALYSDLPAPRCLRVSPDERILVVNRSGAFFRRDEGPVFLRLGGYSARIEPQQAALFPAPVGTYLALGLHHFGGHGAVATPGVLVVRSSCNRRPRVKKPFSQCF